MELLRQLATNVSRALVLWDPSIAAGIGQFAVIQSVAPSAGLDVRPADVRDVAEIERSMTTFSRVPNGGLIVTEVRGRSFPLARLSRLRPNINCQLYIPIANLW